MVTTKNKKLNEGSTSRRIAKGSVSADYNINIDYDGKKYNVKGICTPYVQVSADVYSDPGDYWNPPEYDVDIDYDSIEI